MRANRLVFLHLLLLGLGNVGCVDELHHQPLPALHLPHQEDRSEAALSDLVEFLIFLHCLRLEAYSYCDNWEDTDWLGIDQTLTSLARYQDCKPKQTTSDTVIKKSCPVWGWWIFLIQF